MEKLDNNWLSIGSKKGHFSKTLSLIISDCVEVGDLAVFDRTFASEETLKKYSLIPFSSKLSRPQFCIGVDLFSTLVEESLLREIADYNSDYWTKVGLENICFYRNDVCYLETITHHDSVFVLNLSEKLKSALSECDFFDVPT